jgi:hypothetical protein
MKKNLDADWTSFYSYAQEAIPPNAPKSLGNKILISYFVVEDRVGNHITKQQFQRRWLEKVYTKLSHTQLLYQTKIKEIQQSIHDKERQ